MMIVYVKGGKEYKEKQDASQVGDGPSCSGN